MTKPSTKTNHARQAFVAAAASDNNRSVDVYLSFLIPDNVRAQKKKHATISNEFQDSIINPIFHPREKPLRTTKQNLQTFEKNFEKI